MEPVSDAAVTGRALGSYCLHAALRRGEPAASPQRRRWALSQARQVGVAVGEGSVILMAPPVPLLGVSAGMYRGCRQHESLASDGYRQVDGERAGECALG